MYGLSLFAWINDQMALLLEQWMILYVFQSLAAYIKCSIPRFGEFWRKILFYFGVVKLYSLVSDLLVIGSCCDVTG